jgi:hypothetical protein
LSFLIDPPLLVATGAATGQRFTMKRLAPPVLAAFWGVGAAFYRDMAVTRPFMRLLPGRDGRDFMWTTGVLPIEHDKRRERAKWDKRALGVFATYPFFLWLGTRAAR